MMYYKVKVMSRNFISDFFGGLRNIIGGEIKTYTKLVEQTIKELYDSLLEKHGELRNVRIETSELTNGAIQIIVWGEK